MKHAVTKKDFHRRVARQLERLMSKYNFIVFDEVVTEWSCGLDVSCVLGSYEGEIMCIGARFVHYSGKKKSTIFSSEQMGVTFSPEQVAVNIAKRVKNIIRAIKLRTKVK